jgi:hypothetical protein
MHPFQPNPTWYERHWYSEDRPQTAWRRLSTAARFAAYVLGMAWLAH